MNKVVWHLCSNRWNSAITEYALRSAQALKMRGWDSQISALPGSHCERRAREYGIQGPSSRFKIHNFFQLRAHAKKMKPAAIICYGGPETFLARFLGVPVVRFRGQDSDLSKPLSPSDLKANLGFCAGILTPAELLKKRFQLTLPGMKVESVILGLDAKKFYPQPVARQRPTLLLVGRLDPIKGHAAFLKLYKDLLETHPSPSPFLQILGERSNLTPEQLQAHAESLGLKQGEDYEIVAERVKDLPQRMASACLGVVPSLGSEVIGRVTEEFLLSGTPVLVAKVGALGELLKDQDFGDFLTLESLQAWLKKSQMESFDDRIDRSEKAKDLFSLEVMGKNLEESLESFLKN